MNPSPGSSHFKWFEQGVNLNVSSWKEKWNAYCNLLMKGNPHTHSSRSFFSLSIDLQMYYESNKWIELTCINTALHKSLIRLKKTPNSSISSITLYWFFFYKRVSHNHNIMCVCSYFSKHSGWGTYLNSVWDPWVFGLKLGLIASV